MIESPGLDGWTEPFPDVPTLRRLQPPVEVVADTSHVLPPPGGFTRADGLPLRVRAGGIDLAAARLGTLHSWLRVRDGRWLAQVCVPVRSANGHSGLDLWLWVEASCVSPILPPRSHRG